MIKKSIAVILANITKKLSEICIIRLKKFNSSHYDELKKIA